MKSFKSKFKKEEKCVYPFGSKECGSFLKDSYKESVDEVIILSDKFYEDICTYDEIVRSISELESRKKAIEHKLQFEMKSYGTAFCKERRVSWKTVEKSSVDTKKLRLDHGELVDGYMKTSSSRVFRVK